MLETIAIVLIILWVLGLVNKLYYGRTYTCSTCYSDYSSINKNN